MAEKDPNIVDVETCGITVSIDKRRITDARFTLAVGILMDSNEPEEMKPIAYKDMMKVLFGRDMFKIMNALAEANEGVIEDSTFEQFLTEIIEGANLKN